MQLDLKQRTKAFALSIIEFYVMLPKTTELQIIGKQFLRSGTSLGAHYREASRARSDAEFISKLEVGIQEVDETIYWLELLRDTNLFPDSRANILLNECDQLLAILTTIIKKIKQRNLNK